MTPVTISPAQAQSLAQAAFIAHGASPANAEPTAAALVAAEVDGQTGHGLSRVQSYAAQIRSGKVKGDARVRLERLGPAAARIDAGHGFAYPALALAIDTLAEMATDTMIATAIITHSHHFGQAGAHVEALAERGLIGFLFGNSPQAIAPWGSHRPLFGTNPIAFAAPLGTAPPLVIDLAVSVATRGAINAAKQLGQPQIPRGWALDAAGAPTTDVEAALVGSMVPIGGPKGAALALMVEIMGAALTASQFGFEASSLFDADGPAPDLGQTLIALDPLALSAGAYFSRMDRLIAEIAASEGARLPGTRRLERRRHARAHGLEVPHRLYEQLVTLANHK